MSSPLADLGAVITAAVASAANADTLAIVAIRVSIKKRIEAGEALAQARPPEQWGEWLAQLGLTWPAANALYRFRSEDLWEARLARATR